MINILTYLIGNLTNKNFGQTELDWSQSLNSYFFGKLPGYWFQSHPRIYFIKKTEGQSDDLLIFNRRSSFLITTVSDLTIESLTRLGYVEVPEIQGVITELDGLEEFFFEGVALKYLPSSISIEKDLEWEQAICLRTWIEMCGLTSLQTRSK